MNDYEDGLRRLNPVEWRKQYEGTWEPPGPLSDAELERMERRHYKGNQDAYRLTMEVRRLRGVIADQERTLTAAGIVVGEEGAVRWHGLTGAEIEALRVQASVSTCELNLGHLDAYEMQTYADGALVCGDALSLIEDARILLRERAALAAAAGRGTGWRGGRMTPKKRAMMTGIPNAVSPALNATEAIFDEDYWERKAKRYLSERDEALALAERRAGQIAQLDSTIMLWRMTIEQQIPVMKEALAFHQVAATPAATDAATYLVAAVDRYLAAAAGRGADGGGAT